MVVLGIETTCDETAVAVVRDRIVGGGDILANEIKSQIAQHAAFGGVVPELAARAHVDVIDRLVRRALDTAGMSLADVDAIAAAAGPGLIGSLLVGLTTAKALAWAAGKPFLAINHLEAHALTARLTDNVEFPYLVLLMSGGHTQLVDVRGVGEYRRLGSTVDDALGEAFDKIGKLLGLPYPGGPEIERAALDGDPQRFDFPRPMMGRATADFSFSGLKTAVRLEVERLAPKDRDGARDAARDGSEKPPQTYPGLSRTDVADLCASFQAAVVDVLIDRARVGLRLFRERGGLPTAFVTGGGVAANGAIRRALARFCAEAGLRLVSPPPELCTDNGAMIAWAGIERFSLGLTDGFDAPARPRWPLDDTPAARHHGKA